MEEAQITVVCNTELKKKKLSPPRKENTRTYTPEIRAKMVCYAIEKGPAKAACHLCKEMGERSEQKHHS